MLVCVLNLGLKSMRAAVFDLAGRRKAIAYRPIATEMGEGRVEQSPQDWWSATESVLDEVLADRAMAGETALITVTASAGCLVPLTASFDPAGNAIMISDVRARSQAEAISRLASFAPMASHGRQVTPDLMLPKIAWLRDNDRPSFNATRWFATPNDFLVARLTGEMVTDRYNASKYFYDSAAGGYPSELISDLEINVDTLPPVDTKATLFGVAPSVRARFGFPESAKVVLSTYDAICAVYGSGASKVGDACDVSGTVTSFRAVTDLPIRDPSGRLFVAPHVRPGIFLAGGSNNLGGGVIEWAKQLFYAHEHDPYASLMADVRDAPPGSAGIVFLPYLLGERAPIWDAEARGVMFGLGRNHGRADIVRSIVEGVSYSVLDIADRLDGLGVRVGQVFASGGLARLDPVLQVKADMLGVPLKTNEELESTALGAAIMASAAAGIHPSIEAATDACVRVGAEFEPEPSRTQMYRDFFGVYRDLYANLRELFRDRNRLIGQHRETLRTVPSRSENL